MFRCHVCLIIACWSIGPNLAWVSPALHFVFVYGCCSSHWIVILSMSSLTLFLILSCHYEGLCILFVLMKVCVFCFRRRCCIYIWGNWWYGSERQFNHISALVLSEQLALGKQVSLLHPRDPGGPLHHRRIWFDNHEHRRNPWARVARFSTVDQQSTMGSCSASQVISRASRCRGEARRGWVEVRLRQWRRGSAAECERWRWLPIASPPAPIWRRQGEGCQGCAALCTAVEEQHRYDVFFCGFLH